MTDSNSQKVKLEGITTKGKNRIKEHGKIWTIISTKTNGDVLFEAADGYLKWGPLPDFKIIES